MHLNKIFSKHNRVLLRELVATDFKLRYQGSVLGYLWSLVRPLFLFGILLLVFGYMLKIGSNIPHYPIYLLLGIVLWNFFVESTNSALQSIVGRGDLIRKLNFPKYIIVVSGTISALINLGISLIVVGLFMLFAHVEIRLAALLLPLIIAELYVFALSLGFFLSAFFVKFRDIGYVWELLLQAAFYATPIIYPLSFVEHKSHLIAKLMLLNPMAQIVQDSRYILVSQQTDTLYKLSHSLLLSLIPLVIIAVIAVAGGIYFKSNARYFAEDV